MERQTYSTQGEFTNHVLRLVNQSTNFLGGMRAIKPLHSGTIGSLETVKKSVYSADVSNVSSIGLDLDALDKELLTLLNKFYVIQNSYKADSTMVGFLGDFNKNPQDAYAKLVSYSDGCIQQIDSVITAYSRVEKGITKANLWISHILSHYSPESVANKAVKAQKIIKSLSAVVAQIRNLSHDSKLELLNIRNLTAKYTKPKPAQSAVA